MQFRERAAVLRAGTGCRELRGKQFSRKDYLTIRNEYFNDIKGQRTGFRTQYSERLIVWGHWIGTTVLFRPELLFEHA